MIKRIINKLGIYKTYPLRINNAPFRVPIFNGLGFTHFTDSEPWMDAVLAKLGSPHARFLDVGVNVGQTLLKWKSLFPESTYIGFEPNKHCVKYVENLIAKNKLKHCLIHPYGLATEAAETKLYLLGNDLGDSSATTIPNFRTDENRRAIDIQTIPLIQLEKQPFDLVKIDVEGAELEVLEALFQLEHNPIITCEILPVYEAKNTERIRRQTAIENLLKSRNYAIYRIEKGGKMTLKKITEFGIHSDLAQCDYVFLPKTNENALVAHFN